MSRSSKADEKRMAEGEKELLAQGVKLIRVFQSTGRYLVRTVDGHVLAMDASQYAKLPHI